MCAEEPSAPERECLPLRPVYLSSAQDDVSQGSKVTPLLDFLELSDKQRYFTHTYLKLIRNEKTEKANMVSLQ